MQSEKGVPVEGVKPTQIFMMSFALSEECECPTKEKTPTQPCFSKRYHTHVDMS